MKTIPPPLPYGPTPSPRQLAWHALEFYGFLHFTVNTFTDLEWGYGDESPALFNPTDFDADQIARTAAQGGLRGLILTCKHHDGFCLWPSQYTEHSVKHSPWRNGQGDVVREISQACRRHGLQFGVYLSPWDRNHAEYGRPAYLEYYRAQLRELLTNHGPIFEVWFDGANGGDGYYGGARQRREIDRRTYYEWPTTWQSVRDLQPQACIFSDAGPDVRWVGNERGIAGTTCWHTLDQARFVPGEADNRILNRGQRHGADWLPAECDVSIRPGWFYHASQDAQVRTPENLLDLYFKSVGRGANLLLNLPPDRRGRIHENDAASLLGFRRKLEELFSLNLAQEARLQASNTRGNLVAYRPENLLDGDPQTYWATDDGIQAAEVILEWPRPVEFQVVRLREQLPLGQRVERFALGVEEAGRWRELARGRSIGACRLVKFRKRQAQRIRLSISGVAPFALSELAVF